MAGGDVSGCLEVSSGFGNLLRFNSGKFGIEFDSTGGADERIWGKDPTVDMTAQVFYLEQVQLAAGESTGGVISLVDGSGGLKIVTLPNGDISSGGGMIGVWDFRDDPLRCLTADSTQSLCMSSTVNGRCGGFIKGYWGPKGL